MTFWDMAQQHHQSAIGAFANQTKNIKFEAPDKTFGGALSSGAGMASGGAEVGSLLPGVGTGLGAGIGAGVGFLSYLLS